MSEAAQNLVAAILKNEDVVNSLANACVTPLRRQRRGVERAHFFYSSPAGQLKHASQDVASSHTTFDQNAAPSRNRKLILLLLFDWRLFTTHCFTLPPAGKSNYN